METHSKPNGQFAQTIAELANGAIDLLRSAEHSNPAARQAFDAMQQAVIASKAQDHESALSHLSVGVAQPILAGVRTELPKLIRQAVRQVIGEKFPDLVVAAIRERLTEEAVSKLCEDVLNGQQAERQDLARSVSELTESIQSQTNAISRLTEAGIEESILSISAPGFVARIRDQSLIKTEIGRRVAEAFFAGGRRPSFVLASSTAVHFGLQLRRLPSITGTMFYTNSVAFPLAVLNDCSQHEVGVFWQRVYDDQCGGWLPVIGDEPYFAALRNYFRPDSFGLTTSLLTPRKLSVEHGMSFLRAETAKVGRTLVESAQETILMVPADRICRSLAVHEQAGGFPAGADWRSLNKQIHVVVAGATSGSDIDSLVETLTEQGLWVHLQPAESTQWRVHPAK